MPAEAFAPAPLSVDVMLPVWFILRPRSIAVTVTEKMQELPAAIVPPVSAMELARGTAVTVPPHEPVKPFGLATTSPAGSGSVKATPLRLVEFGLWSVNVNVVLAKNGMELTPKDLAIVGAAIWTSAGVIRNACVRPLMRP